MPIRFYCQKPDDDTLACLLHADNNRCALGFLYLLQLREGDGGERRRRLLLLLLFHCQGVRFHLDLALRNAAKLLEGSLVEQGDKLGLPGRHVIGHGAAQHVVVVRAHRTAIPAATPGKGKYGVDDPAPVTETKVAVFLGVFGKCRLGVEKGIVEVTAMFLSTSTLVDLGERLLEGLADKSSFGDGELVKDFLLVAVDANVDVGLTGKMRKMRVTAEVEKVSWRASSNETFSKQEQQASGKLNPLFHELDSSSRTYLVTSEEAARMSILQSLTLPKTS